jgi:hypothetical protein
VQLTEKFRIQSAYSEVYSVYILVITYEYGAAIVYSCRVVVPGTTFTYTVYIVYSIVVVVVVVVVVT